MKTEVLQHELTGAGLVAGAVLALIVLAEVWRARWQGAAEHTRKLVHIGGGLVCVGLPFLVTSVWTVLALNVGLVVLFLVGGRLKRLQSLHGVERASRGSEYFPLAVFLLYLVAAPLPWLYVSSLLVLTLADAAAALAGTRYGRIRFQVEEETKSLEGSAAFFVVAFLVILLPLLLLSDLSRETCVLAALLVALLVTGFEIISLHGTDNLFVPVAVCVVLGKITTKPTGEIAFQLLSLCGLALLVTVLARRVRVFNTGAAVGVVLFVYGVWSLASVTWAIPVLVGLLYYVVAVTYTPRQRPGSIEIGTVKVRTVAQAFLPAFGILVVANVTQAYGFWFAPFLAAAAAVLAFSLRAYAARTEAVGPWDASVLVGVVACHVAACLAVQPDTRFTGVAMVVLVLAVSKLEEVVNRPTAAQVTKPQWNAWWFLLVLAAAGAVALLQRVGFLPPWYS